MQNTENKEIWTALYARLSMDDGNVGVQILLERYAYSEIGGTFILI